MSANVISRADWITTQLLDEIASFEIGVPAGLNAETDAALKGSLLRAREEAQRGDRVQVQYFRRQARKRLAEDRRSSA